MPESSINADMLFSGGSRTLLERVICAEYLLANG